MATEINLSPRKSNTAFYAKVVIYLILLFGIGCLPTFGQVTPMGMKVLGVFVATIFGWIFFEMIWPSFFALLALGWIGYSSVAESLTVGFSYYMIPMMFACYLIVGVFVDSRAAEYIAHWVISRKMMIGKPFRIVLMVFLIAVILGLCGIGFAGFFIIWGFVYALADAMGHDRKSAWVQYICCAICPIVVQGGQCFPFYSGAIIYNGFFKQAMGQDLPFMGFIAVNVSILVVMALALYGVLRLFIRPDFSALSGDKDIYAQYRGEKMTFEQRLGAIFLVTYILLLSLPSFLPATWLISRVLDSLGGVVGVSLFLAVLATLVRKKDGTTYYDLAKGSSRHISWPVMWMIIATIPLANAFQAEQCGILQTVMAFLTPLLGNMDPILFAVCCMILVGISTQFIHNIILAIVFIPIFCHMMVNMGGNPYLVYIYLFWALNLSFVTPAASMTAVIMHGNENVTPKWSYASGIIILVVGSLVTILCGLPLVNIFMPY